MNLHCTQKHSHVCINRIQSVCHACITQNDQVYFSGKALWFISCDGHRVPWGTHLRSYQHVHLLCVSWWWPLASDSGRLFWLLVLWSLHCSWFLSFDLWVLSGNHFDWSSWIIFCHHVLAPKWMCWSCVSNLWDTSLESSSFWRLWDHLRLWRSWQGT